MAKPIKIWSGTEWVEVATSIPNLSGYATTSALSAHESDTTNIHGIADTANLATNSSVTSAISAHESDTTNVHGIVNTANLALTTGSLSQFVSTTSSQLAGVISDETGSGSLVFSTSPTISYPVMVSPEERFNIVASAATGVINFDLLTSTVWYYTSNATADHTLNFRGNSGTTLNSMLTVGDSISAIWLNTNGTTAYRPTVFQIDGSAVTPRWSGGTAPASGNSSSIDAYSFTIVKTAATPTYVVLAGQTRFA
jgi:hypothetical protein